MSIWKLNANIKNRQSANDVFITPIDLVKTHLDIVAEYVSEEDVLLDPFFGTGNYYNTFSLKFPNNKREFLEIEMGKDFFEYNDKVDVIISNPPYSILDKVLEKSVKLNPHTISYLIGINNLTCKRIEYMNKNGYVVSKMHLTKVYKWFGMSCIVVFTKKETKNCILFDRIVWMS